MKAKIKEVVSIKPWGDGANKTFYHNLLMDNGEKINIGKKKKQQVGWDLTYEIIEEGQEYNKAKTPKVDFVPNTGTATVNDSILYQVCLKGAIEISLLNPSTLSPDDINQLALEIAKGAKSNISKL